MTNRQILIDSLPDGALEERHFRAVDSPLPEPGDGEVLCRTLAISIDAGARAGLQGSASYAGAPRAGVVMNGTTVARVERSNDDRFRPGDVVIAPSGWQTHAVHPARVLDVVDGDGDPARWLGVLGGTGLTAWFGLIEIGRPRPGETVVVSAAAGATGHIVGQLARVSGARAVGIAGSDDKCARRVDELGFDAAVNHRDGGFRQALKEACPRGIDVYFDNTGGDVLGAALFRMNERGRIVCCGVVSQYDTSTPAPGPRGVPGLLVNKRLTMQGFLVFDHAARYGEARARLRALLDAGALTAWQDEFEGLESAPRAFVDLLAGGNAGKRIVRVAQ
jgi:NADPH-dependent curcumin reductase CurA